MTSEAAEISALDALHHYPLQAPIIIGRNGEGFTNDDWIVLDNATGRKYALRGDRRACDAARMTFELAFQEHLRTAGFPAAPVIRTTDGALFASVSGRFWSLSGFIEGQPYDFASRAQAREAGRRLSQFQSLAESFAGPFADPPGPGDALIGSPLPCYLWRESVLTDEHDEQLRALYPGPQFADDLSFFTTWRRQAAAAWPPERLAALPQCWLHCDYHGRNMVFRDDTMAGLFDFDFVTRGPRVYDIARGIFNFGRENRGSTTLREEFCRAFFDGFKEEATLTKEEVRSLPFMATLNWAPDAAIDARPEEALKSDVTPSRMQSAVRLMRGVDAEMRRLAPQFGWGDA